MPYIVDGYAKYDYNRLVSDLDKLKNLYDFIDTGSIGRSVLGRELYFIRIGSGENKVLYNGAHHALEWITTPVLIKFVEDISSAFNNKKSLAGYDIVKLFKKSSIYIIPMVNPDGVDIVLNGVNSKSPYYEMLMKWGKAVLPSIWQANTRGVDLNHNYDAAFDLGKKAEIEHGITNAGPTRYSGERPFSEPESRALAQFTTEIAPRLVMAFHTQGEEIYWNFGDKKPKGGQEIGKLLERESGYKLCNITGIASYGGYKDWFINMYNRPGYTIELGHGKNPLPPSQFEEIYRKTLGILIFGGLV